MSSPDVLIFFLSEWGSTVEAVTGLRSDWRCQRKRKLNSAAASDVEGALFLFICKMYTILSRVGRVPVAVSNCVPGGSASEWEKNR